MHEAAQRRLCRSRQTDGATPIDGDDKTCAHQCSMQRFIHATAIGADSMN